MNFDMLTEVALGDGEKDGKRGEQQEKRGGVGGQIGAEEGGKRRGYHRIRGRGLRAKQKRNWRQEFYEGD